MKFNIRIILTGIILAFCIVLFGGVQAGAETFNGLEVTPLGQAVLTTYDDSIIVSNFITGDLETDGIFIDLANAVDKWYCLADNVDADNSLPIGAGLQIMTTGVVGGVPNQFIGGHRQTKIADNQWQLEIGSEAESYKLEAFLDNELVYTQDGFTGDGSKVVWWAVVATVVAVDIILRSDWENAGSSDTTLPDGTKIHREWEAGYTLKSHGMVNIPNGPSDLEVDEIRLTTENLPYSFTKLSSISMFGKDLQYLKIREMYASRAQGVPSLTEWGLIFLLGLILISGIFVIYRRHQSNTA